MNYEAEKESSLIDYPESIPNAVVSILDRMIQ